MQQDYWQKQEASKPLYPDLIWSRPENKSQAGKLLIMGGNVQSFAAVAQGYGVAIEAAIGTARVLMPDRLQKTVSSLFVGGEYAPSTPSGSFSRQALAVALDNAAWADAVLLAGDFGRNSETAIMLEQFVEKYKGLVCITKDSIEYFNNLPLTILDRDNTMLSLSLSQLQKLSLSARNTEAVTLGMDLIRLADFLHNFTIKHRAIIITKHLGTIFVAVNGQITTTKPSEDKPLWRVETATKACVWWAQNPSKSLEAITTSLVA